MVRQKLEIGVHDQEKDYVLNCDILESHDITGVAALEPNKYQTNMTLDLSRVKNDIDQNVLINAEKPKSVEEIFML